MAISWATIEKSSGTGSAKNSVVVTSQNNGRNSREGYATITINGVSKNCQIKQEGRPEFSELEDTYYHATSEQGTFNLIIDTNARRLNAELSKGLSLQSQSYSTDNGETWHNYSEGQETPTDPGKTQEYLVKFSIGYPQNTSPQKQTYSISVTDNAGNNGVCQIVQSGVQSSISINPISLTFTQNEAYKAIKTALVTSNEAWTINGSTGTVYLGVFAIDFKGSGSELISARVVKGATTTQTSVARLQTTSGATATLTLTLQITNEE